MDIRDQVMGNKPTDFLHKIAGIIPGFNGYMDRERRRDADKLLRTYLAHQYNDGRARLTRVEQSMVRGGNLQYIAEVDRITGVLQRFIDRLTTATYGYAGLFDPIKIEGPQLDMLYAFDMALTEGVDQVSSAVSSLESAASGTATDANAVPNALDKLATLVDDLNNRLNQRQDFLSTGQGLPQDQYNAMLTQINQGATPAVPATPATPATPAIPPVAPTQPEVPSSANAPYVAPSQTTMSGTPSTGAPTMPMSSAQTQPSTDAGQMARVQGSGASDTGSSYSDESKPETPRTTPPDTMGVAGVYIPPVEQWQGIPHTDTSSTADTSETSGESEASTADTSSSDTSSASTPAHTAGPTTASASDSWSGDASFGSSGDTQSISDTGAVYGSGESSSGSISGDYGSSDTSSDSGIQSASSPSMLGGDVADGNLLTGSSDSVTTRDSDGSSDSDLSSESSDSDLNPRSNM